MRDIIDAGARPHNIGVIAGEPNALAARVIRHLRRECASTIVFIHEGTQVLAHDAAYADSVEPDAIVGLYRRDARPQDIADDLQACCAAQMRAIGMIV